MTRAAFRDRAVYLPDGDALVLADLHVGRGEASDVEFPLGEADDLRNRLEALLARYEPREVVFAGDVLHQFSRVSDRVVRSVEALTDTCRTAGARPVFVAGNHDTRLDACWNGPIHDGYRIERADASGGSDESVTTDGPATPDGSETGDGSARTDADDTGDESAAADASRADPPDPAVPDGEYAPSLAHPVVVRHGHEAPPDAEARGAGTYLLGHDHPTLDVEGRRRPCYLHVPDATRGTDAVVLPAFNRLPAGVTVNGMRGSDFQSPFVTNPDDARPLVWDDDAGRVLPFPPLGEFRRLL